MSGSELNDRPGGVLSRRAVLRRAALASSAMGTALLVGCSPAVPTSPSSTTTAATPPAAKPAAANPAATTGQPKRGGTLQIMNTADPPDLDPHQSTASVLNTVLVLTYNGLLRYNVAPGNTANSAAAFTVVPDLATRWDNPDPLTYVFHLRQGVKFHDGSEFTAEDAAFSLNRIRTKSSEYQRASAFAPVDSVEATDKYTVTVKLSTPYAAFINEVAVGYTRMAPKHAVEQYGDLKRNIIGTGPFKLKEYTRGQRFVFERNPDYYESGIPYLDQIVLTVIPDAAAAVAAFQAGQLDVYQATFQNLQVIKQSVPDLVVGDYQLLNISGIALNVKVKPLDDVRVRQAMWYTINQPEIINTVFQGDGVKGRLVPPAYAGWAVPFDQLPLNDAPTWTRPNNCWPRPACRMGSRSSAAQPRSTPSQRRPWPPSSSRKSASICS
jgi:peptide/nickel transport system substrate-binding protein